MINWASLAGQGDSMMGIVTFGSASDFFFFVNGAVQCSVFFIHPMQIQQGREQYSEKQSRILQREKVGSKK